MPRTEVAQATTAGPEPARPATLPAAKPHPEMPSARSMPDAANAENSLQGYAAVNDISDEDEIRQLAYQLYQQRNDEPGSPDDDWFRAEREVRTRRQGLNAT